MDSTRQHKISRLLQRDMAELVQLNSKSWFGGIMVTVSGVKITSDLSIAKIYVSIFPAKDKQQIIDILEQNGSYLRLELGKRIKNQLRIVPALRFYIDDSLDYVENIDKILKP
ncbi:MAG: 30S ribosome-binding factor RbfA [Bacteroidales bacterium]|nr:30S ribosome-binding factor RbfA [Bacteroidales bacterium]